MSWNINSNANSTWTNNATNESIGVVANKIGTSTTTGYKIATSKKLYFGNSQEINFNFNNSMFNITYTNPSTKQSINIINYNPTTDTTSIHGISFKGIDFQQSTSNALGVPSESPESGKVVYTLNSLGLGSLYVGV